jgi:hypothetical protein
LPETVPLNILPNSLLFNSHNHLPTTLNTTASAIEIAQLLNPRTIQNSKRDIYSINELM